MHVRDAMVADPKTLSGSSTAQEAGVLLAKPDVRAVLVCEDGRLLGIVTAATLVERVVAAGRDPGGTPLRDVVEADVFTVAADADLDEAFRLLEDRDAERVPVLDGGRLVGVLSRSSLQRRLAEDEPPADDA